ncbi:MAG TPA: hypothetical protein VIE19_10460 [Lapillicoccus sp.]|jgi:hypothetical protein
MAVQPEDAGDLGRPVGLPSWVPVVLVVALGLGVVKQVYGLAVQVFPATGPGNGGAEYISLSLRLAQWAIWPDYTEVGPMVLVPAVALLWFTVSRATWTPTPGSRTRTMAAVLLGTCAGLAVLRGVGVLLWFAGTDDVSRASIGYVSGSGALLFFNSGMLGQLWFAAVGGVLTWCLLVAQPESGTVRRSPVGAPEVGSADRPASAPEHPASEPPAAGVRSPPADPRLEGSLDRIYRRPTRRSDRHTG